MNTRTLITMMGLAVLVACAYPQTKYDAHFGEATRATLNAQIINPQAPTSTTLTDMDGRSANATINNYYKGYVAPNSGSGNTFSFNVGGGSSSNSNSSGN